MHQHDIELYRKMYLIRSAERIIQKHYLEDEMKTPLHIPMGEDAIVEGFRCNVFSSDSTDVAGEWQ